MAVHKEGYGAPFIFITTSRGTFLRKIKNFTYVHSEKKDDEATIVVETVDINLPDRPEFQEGAELRIIWGYINGVTAHRRKVYIKDLMPRFTKNGIIVTIKAYDKFSKAKQNTGKDIRENVTLSDVAKDVADKNGLRFEGVVGRDILVSKTWGTRIPDILKNEGNFAAAIDKTSAVGQAVFKLYDVLPQGNKSDFKLLQDMAEKEPGGPFVVEGRDGDLIVKKRDLSQVPIKNYHYGGGSFELISFSPEVKNRAKKSESVNVTSTGWDPENKQYIQTESNEQTAEADHLGDLADGSVKSQKISAQQEKLDDIEKLQEELNPTEESPELQSLRESAVAFDQDNAQLEDEPKDEAAQEDASITLLKNTEGIIIGRLLDTTSPSILESSGNFTTAVDNTAVVKVLPNAVNQYDLGINQDTIEQNILDIKAEGDNTKGDGALDKNPAKLNAIGDPRVISGKVIHVTGISKKYSGNYYVKTATHTLTFSGGYLMTLELVRNAVNLTGEEDSTDLIKTTELKGSVNKEKAPEIQEVGREILTIEDIPPKDEISPGLQALIDAAVTFED